MTKKIEKKTLIIVSSPFQAICAVESITFFNIKSYEILIVLYITDKNQDENCRAIFDMHGLKYKERIFTSFFDGVKYISGNRQEQDYSHIILGDYFNLYQRLLAAHYLSSNGEIIFLDDGASSYRIFEGKTVHSKFRWEIKRLLPDTIISLKHGKRNNLFTIFDLPKSKEWNVWKNNLASLRTNDIVNTQEGIIIVGANTAFFESIMDKPFVDLLQSEILWIKKNYPTEKIYYYPHRRDKDNIAINSYLQRENVEIVDTRFTIEVDIVINKRSPKLIIGYGSTALYVLNCILKQTRIRSVFVHTNSNSINGIYKKISESYQSQGIEILHL